MTYALVHYPQITTESINRLRRQYDPLVNLIEPHITVIFPLPDAVNEPRLIAHIEHVLREFTPFPVTLGGLEKSWDDYLFLLLQTGKEEVIKLYEALYTDMLAHYRNHNIAYTPHITLGRFAGAAEKYAQAREEAEGAQLTAAFLLDRVHLVKTDEAMTQILSTRAFILASR